MLEAGRLRRAPSARLASAVMFVRELERSTSFYRELLGMEVTVRSDSAVLLVGAGSQLYLRERGPGAEHALGSVGVQYVIWTAVDEADLLRCERFLEERSAYVQSHAVDGFTLVEGRDPSGLPVMVTYPGPDEAVRHQISARLYSW